ncbi:SulP family inorganic anion transporter [Rarobacter faecitabidus]|uniref:SulP family sulfate permease n=1 Tax=Rarobacter faecitabidus TaxID=13243 RepID=A0A542ZWX7_RARFA|nr:SulP family inorganic anion transporter [Rarobacter faecitabidus]TQL64863.1 SulP family sulfate permease [Rarobacter faecitabidus]
MKQFLTGASAMLPNRSDYAGLGRTWRSDVVAGITVGIVALPLALAFGVSSGVGAEAGLVTAIVAGIVAAVFGGSNVQVSGPTGAMVVVLGPVVAAHGAGAVVIVAVLAGIVVCVAGVLRLGRTVTYIPWPVIEGFTAGIGVIIFLQQVPTALGVGPSGHHSTNAGVAAAQSVSQARWPGVLVPLAVVAAVAIVMGLAARLAPKAPASFIAIVVVSVAAIAFDLPLATIGELPQSLPAPQLPAVNLHMISSLAGPVFAVAALAAIESLLSARVASSMSDTGPYNADRELVGQGLASVFSGIFGGMPATGAIARTAVNVRSGARTRLAAVVHALGLVAVVYLAAPLVSRIPLAALAGVLMVTACRMIEISVIRQVLGATRSAALVFGVTAIVTVGFDLIVAVAIGVAVAAFFALRALSRTCGVRREEIPGPARSGDERIAIFRLDGSLFFGVADRVMQRVADHGGVDIVILRLSHLQHVDATGAHTLAEIVQALERAGVTVFIKGIRPGHLQVMTRVGALDALRHPNHLFDDLEAAVAAARGHLVHTG